MRQVPNLISAQGTTTARVLGPAEHSGFKERTIDNQLTATLEQIGQANLALGSVELVRFLHGQPRHPSALGSQRIAGARHRLLFHEELLARSVPLLLRHDRGCVHGEVSFPLLLVSVYASCHVKSPSRSETDRSVSLGRIF